jgi:hypothetical protein
MQRGLERAMALSDSCRRVSLHWHSTALWVLFVEADVEQMALRAKMRRIWCRR